MALPTHAIYPGNAGPSPLTRTALSPTTIQPCLEPVLLPITAPGRHAMFLLTGVRLAILGHPASAAQTTGSATSTAIYVTLISINHRVSTGSRLTHSLPTHPSLAVGTHQAPRPHNTGQTISRAVDIRLLGITSSVFAVWPQTLPVKARLRATLLTEFLTPGAAIVPNGVALFTDRISVRFTNRIRGDFREDTPLFAAVHPVGTLGVHVAGLVLPKGGTVQ